MKNGFLAFVIGASAALSSGIAISEELCADGSAPVTRLVGSSGTHAYEGVQRHLGQPVLAEAGHTGQGTAVAHIEDKSVAWFFRHEDGRPPPFGYCVQPEDAPADHWGWAPESDPAYPDQPCRIAWVMCIEAFTEGGIPVYEHSTGSSRAIKPCLRPTNGMTLKSKRIWSENIGGHATTAAMGITSMAPDTKIIALALNGVDALDAQAAFRWLYTRGNDYKHRWPLDSNDMYLTGDDSLEWKRYWRKTFGDQTPAQKFNIVSAALTWRINVGGFSEVCEAVNPAIPQTDTDKDGLIDVADNCVWRYNAKRVNYGTKEEPYWITEYPDADNDGRGNRCDADMDNDNDVDETDIRIFRKIFRDFDNFTPPIDINKDGAIDELDKEIFYKAADTNWDGVVDKKDRKYMREKNWYRSPGMTNKDILPQYEEYRNPDKYLQDRLYLQDKSLVRQSAARHSSFADEFDGMRKAGIVPVIPSGSDGYTNGLLWPACEPGALPVAGVQHTSDLEVAYRFYNKDTNTYNPPDGYAVRVNVSQKLPIITTHGPGRNWQPLGNPPLNSSAPGCLVEPLRSGGYAGSYTPPVVAGSIAALRSPGLLSFATPAYVEKILAQTSERAYVRRDCTEVLLSKHDPYDPAKEDIYCPEYLSPDVDDTRLEYSIPLMNLADAKRVIDEVRLSAGVQPDSDGDGFFDDADNCIYIANEDQHDSDGDAYGDACDADYNNDGMTDWVDGITFAGYLDTKNIHGDFNADGVSNGEDYDHLMTKLMDKPPGPSGLDRDLDGVADHLDNCQAVSNGPWTTHANFSEKQRNQLDSDQDFFGDACDGDITQDTVVDFRDRQRILDKIKLNRYYDRADWNADGVTDQQDLDYFDANLYPGDWQSVPPGPSGLCRFWLKMTDEQCNYYNTAAQ